MTFENFKQAGRPIKAQLPLVALVPRSTWSYDPASTPWFVKKGMASVR